MKIKLVFKMICFIGIFLLSTKMQAQQKTQKSYVDIIDYLKIEKFNNKVKEVSTEHTEYDDSFGRDESNKKIKSYTKSMQIFNKFGCIVSQIDQISSYSFRGSKNQKKNTRINYEYDTKQKLLKEKVYTNIDTITLKPIDTTKYSLKIYKYNNKPLKEILEFNEAKELIKKTTFVCDTIKFTLTIINNELVAKDFQFKTIHQFDNNSVLIKQSYFKNENISGIKIITYNENGFKLNATFSSSTSMYQSSESYKYNNQGILIEQSEGSNLDPGIKKYYNYTFDNNSNWLTKEIKNEEGIVVESFKRKITYFN